MSTIKNLFHVSPQVTDFDEAIDFYVNKLGFEQMFLLKVSDFRNILNINDSDKNNDVKWLTYLRVAPEQYLEVFNNVINPPTFEVEPVRTDKSIVYCYTLGCDDCAATIAELEKRGVEVVNGMITDPSGNKFRIAAHRTAVKPQKERLFNCLLGVSIYVNDLEYMKNYFTGMQMPLLGRTASNAMFECGDEGQFIEIIQAVEDMDTGFCDKLGHIALQVKGIAESVWVWGNNGVRCCFQPMMKDTPLEVKKDTVGNFATDGCEIVWSVTDYDNRFEIMYQPGNTLQQRYEKDNPF